MSNSKRPLYIRTYDRGTYALTGTVKPYHWLFFIKAQDQAGGDSTGITHQLRGMPGGFYYPGPENDVDLSELGPRKGELEVGEVEEKMLERVHEILKGLRIDTVESSGWNCQNWTLEGFEKLKAEGVVYEYLTKEAIRNWLKEE